MIYHVTTKSQWDEAVSKGFFEVESLQIEGFIHMSKIDQVEGVLNRYYQNVSDLVLLHVEENKLTAEIKYELSPSVNQEFPHVFGPINIDAVVKVEAIN
jgi:uncharacterized protein (DUF952 family)